MYDKLLKSGVKEIDLTNDKHGELIVETVHSILKEGYTLEQIEKTERELLAKKDNSLIFPLLSLKIAKSKMLARQTAAPLHISIVFAVYKEHNRIKRASEHPHGEDFLRKKVRQLQFLFEDSPNITWEMIIVDDGCPEKSGAIAQEIVRSEQLQDKVRVLFLADAIRQKLPPVQGLQSTAGSQKGGSVVYGMWDAVQKHGTQNHIVIFTDADLSTHLGQTMLLVDPILHQNKLAAIGSRRERESVVIKKGSRNNRGKLFIYLWKRLLPNLDYIVDTQCGFKGFRADIIPVITKDMIEKKFAFDIELLLKTELIRKNAIAKVPVAWIDSEAASTTTDLQPYLPMLQSIVEMYRKYLQGTPGANEFADFIESLNQASFDQILHNIPREIANREPYEFSGFDGVKVRDFGL